MFGICCLRSTFQRLRRPGQADVRNAHMMRRPDNAGRLGAVSGVGAADDRYCGRPCIGNRPCDTVGIDCPRVDRLDTTRRKQIRREGRSNVVLGQRSQGQ